AGDWVFSSPRSSWYNEPKSVRSAGRPIMQLRKMSELEQRMTDDFDWAMHAPEVQQNPEHYGKFVVVYNKHILGVGRDRQALVKKTAEEVGVLAQHLVVVIVHR